MKWVEFKDSLGRRICFRPSSVDGIWEIEQGYIQIYLGTHFINVQCDYDAAQNLVFGDQEETHVTGRLDE